MTALEPTYSQKPIWVGQRLDPESPLYNMAFGFVLPAELREDAFCEAWRRVAGASDALRTRLAPEEGGGMRLELAGRGPETTLADLGARPEPVEAFRRFCRERCARPFPPGGELVESVLVRLGPGRTGWYLNQHHLVTDAWSTRLLYEAVGAEYEALVRGASGERAALAPYYPTSAALAARASARALDEARAHWAARAELPGRSAALYGLRGEPERTASERATLELDEERSRKLDRLAGQEGFESLSPELSRFALFATLLVTWLHRVSGQTDLGFDAPVAGRGSAEAKRALGLFIEMFPFAASVAPGDSFRSLGARCLEEAKLLLRHALPGTGAPAGERASNVVLNYIPVAFGPFAGLRADVRWVHSGHGDRVHALRLQVHDFPGAGRYTLHFDVKESVLSSTLRRRAREHFEKLLDACLDDPDRPIAAVDVLVDAEREAIASLDATEISPLPDRTVVARFQEQADLEPRRVALREGDTELTFADVRLRSDALAASLVRAGVGPGDRVAIFGRRSADFVLAVLAVLRARAAYVPIEAASPRARVDAVLEDSGARVLLLGEGAEPPAGRAGVTVLGIAEAIRAGEGALLERPGPTLGDLAYLLYTSGSTGRPKGVLVEHAGLADYVFWAERQYVRGERLAFPLFTSVAFDLTVTSLFLPLVTGGVLEIYPEPEGPADTALMDVLEANAVDFIKLTPSHLSLLRRIGLEGSRLRRMVVGGEDLKTSLAAAIDAQLHGGVEIFNEYGPTEAVVGCMIHRYDPERDLDPSVPIGGPADHVALEVLNEAQAPVPLGVPGELWIRRFGLARGYHGLEELTVERFQPHPRRPESRRYRTGDLVRMVSPGKLEYLGRLDRQLKVSGLRVEPGEIEAALAALPGIEQCAVVARSPVAPPARAQAPVRHCLRCGLASSYPRAVFDDAGVCSLCRSYESIRERAQAYFRTMDDLRALFDASTRSRGSASNYDCLMLLSGGKDSTYALCRLVDLGLSVYAFTLDNGFLAEGAKENIRRVTEELGVPVELATTPAMPDIFRDSLTRFANVCNGCFKTIYTLGLKRARELSIPFIVTGLSRGQMFETRLTEEMFRGEGREPEEIDAAVLAARKVYHRVPDAVTRSLGLDLFEDDRIFEEVQFVDFYRYCDVGMGELYAYLRRRVPWVRPEDTGRSTNCLINDAGIYVHKRERGYHNYALPYSWDVRLGHKERAAALEELDDHIDEEGVRETLAQIGYDPDRLVEAVHAVTLEAFYVASGDVSENELRDRLGERLPKALVPAHLHRVDALPLSASGKVDERALLRQASPGLPERPYRAPEGPVERFLAQVWQEELSLERVGADDGFFELGGTSLSAMQVVLRLCQEYALDLPLDAVFSHPRLRELAKLAEDRILADDAVS